MIPEPKSVSRDDFVERPGYATMWSLYFLVWAPLHGLKLAAMRTWEWLVYLGGQLRAALGHLWMFVNETQIDEIIPPGLRDFINWLISMVPKAVGVRGTTPGEQIRASIILAIAVILGVITSWLAVVFAFTATVGLLRFVPVLNRLWLRFTDALPIKRDYDLPLWESE